MKAVEHDPLRAVRQPLSRGADIRVPHVHGHSLNLRKLLTQKLPVIALKAFLSGLGYPYVDESSNPVYRLFLR